MHNCKTTKHLMTELLSEGISAPTQELLIELRRCRECHQEFGALKDALGSATEAIESVAPPEEYWSGYHATLKQKLLASRQPVITQRQPSWIVRMFQTSIRVPVPAGLALILLLGGSLFFAIRAAAPKETLPPVVIHVPVEVPVVQERVVTRVVYRDRQRPAVSRKLDVLNEQSTLARSQKKELLPPSLVGFKPLDEIKLTVIKGGTGNDK